MFWEIILKSLLSSHGIKVDEEKVKVIKDCSILKNGSEAESFYRIASFNRIFVFFK